MPEVQESIEINASPEECYKVIWDFAKYPEFLDSVDATKVKKKKGNTCEVEFSVSVIKTVNYTVKAKGVPGESVEWQLVAGDFFKKNDGHWDLEELEDGVTLATYTLDVDMRMFVPKTVTKMLIGSNLPGMLQAFKERIESL